MIFHLSSSFCLYFPWGLAFPCPYLGQMRENPDSHHKLFILYKLSFFCTFQSPCRTSVLYTKAREVFGQKLAQREKFLLCKPLILVFFPLEQSLFTSPQNHFYNTFPCQRLHDKVVFKVRNHQFIQDSCYSRSEPV